jgi:hypothetical protein
MIQLWWYDDRKIIQLWWYDDRKMIQLWWCDDRKMIQWWSYNDLKNFIELTSWFLLEIVFNQVNEGETTKRHNLAF